MGFIKMRDLYGKEIKISASATKAYENLGFYPVEETTTSGEENTKVKETKNSGKTEDEVFVDEVTKKPLASWSKEEVKRYASINDIDLTGTKSANDAKERIKAFMSDAE